MAKYLLGLYVIQHTILTLSQTLWSQALSFTKVVICLDLKDDLRKRHYGRSLWESNAHKY